jgi:hypothetical protein
VGVKVRKFEREAEINLDVQYSTHPRNEDTLKYGLYYH